MGEKESQRQETPLEEAIKNLNNVLNTTSYDGASIDTSFNTFREQLIKQESGNLLRIQQNLLNAAKLTASYTQQNNDETRTNYFRGIQESAQITIDLLSNTKQEPAPSRRPGTGVAAG